MNTCSIRKPRKKTVNLMITKKAKINSIIKNKVMLLTHSSSFNFMPTATPTLPIQTNFKPVQLTRTYTEPKMQVKSKEFQPTQF